MNRSLNPSDVYISFIIPCYNGGQDIQTVIRAIGQNFIDRRESYEIIVVDNRSDDDSAELARLAGANVIESNSNTVAAVRNDGVKFAKGNILAFIDADVEIGKSWSCVLLDKIAIKPDSRFVTGSHCVVPEDIKQPFYSWYKAIEHDGRNTHLGSGHMILSRVFFNEIGGFDETLKSGEDYDLCRKARNFGGVIVADPELVAVHLGYPSSVLGFLSRECWHGEADFSNIQAFLQSKVAIFSIIFFGFQVGALLAALAGSLLFLMIFLFSMVSSLVLFVYIKFGFRNLKSFFNNILVSYLYLNGRACSLIYSILEREKDE